MSKELLKQVIHSIINEDDAVSQTKLHDYLVAKMKMLSEEGEENQEGKSDIIPQSYLASNYEKGHIKKFVKQTPVALVPFQKLEDIVGDDVFKKIESMVGAVDKTTYDKIYKENGFAVMQWDSNKNHPDIYIASPSVVEQKYVKYTGVLPSESKARSKIPSLVCLDHLCEHINYHFMLKQFLLK